MISQIVEEFKFLNGDFGDFGQRNEPLGRMVTQLIRGRAEHKMSTLTLLNLDIIDIGTG